MGLFFRGVYYIVSYDLDAHCQGVGVWSMVLGCNEVCSLHYLYLWSCSRNTDAAESYACSHGVLWTLNPREVLDIA